MNGNERYASLAELEAGGELEKAKKLLEDMAGEMMMWRGQAAAELPLRFREAGFSRGIALDAAKALVDKYWID